MFIEHSVRGEYYPSDGLAGTFNNLDSSTSHMCGVVRHLTTTGDYPKGLGA